MLSGRSTMREDNGRSLQTTGPRTTALARGAGFTPALEAVDFFAFVNCVQPFLDKPCGLDGSGPDFSRIWEGVSPMPLIKQPSVAQDLGELVPASDPTAGGRGLACLDKTQ